MTSTPIPVTTIRPAPAARQRTLLWGLLPAVPAFLVLLLNVRLGDSRFIVVAFLLVALAAYLTLYFTQTRLEYGDGSYRYYTALFQRHFTVADVERAIAVDRLHYGLNGASTLFVVGRTRRRLFRMNSVAWDAAQVEAVINDLIGWGVPLSHYPGQLTPGEFERREPRVLYWHEGHRAAFIAIVLGGGLLLGFGVIIAFIAMLSLAFG